MGVFIQLTALERNGKPFTKSILVDVNRIVDIIVENANNDSIIKVDADNYYDSDNFREFETYVVDEDLAAIDLLTNEVFLGTIVSEDGRNSPYPSALFVKSRVVGTVREVAPGGNSEFDYKQMVSASPRTFIVSEDLATINT